MVPLEGEELNSLFDELARWNTILEAENIDWDALDELTDANFADCDFEI